MVVGDALGRGALPRGPRPPGPKPGPAGIIVPSTIAVTRVVTFAFSCVAWSAVTLPSFCAVSIFAFSSATSAAMRPSRDLPAVAAAICARV